MADIFVSYSHSDRERVELIVAALEASGYSVWMDRHLAPGSRFSKTLSDELDQAKAVIVAWSESANVSVWVADEASVARDTGRLVPVSLDALPPPLGFRQFQTTDLSKWRGGAEEAPFPMLASAIGALIRGEAPPTLALALAIKKKNPGGKRLFYATIAIGIAGFAFGTHQLLQESKEKLATQQGEINEASYLADDASIAIIPFANVSSDPAHSAFVDGLSDELIGTVASIKGLRVPGRSSSFYFKDKAATALEISRQLNVRYVLEGSVRRDGDNLRITSQLTDAKTGFQVWSQTYDRELVDLFAVQTEIAKEVTGKLQGVIGAVSLSDAMKNVDPKAHEMFLVGLGRMHNRFAGSGWQEAMEAFQAAVDIDPDYPLANAYLAVTLAVVRPEGAAQQAMRALKIAVDAMPESPDVIYAQGFIAENFGEFGEGPDKARAQELFDRALSIDPTHSESLFASIRLEPDNEKTLEGYRKLLEIDPLFYNARLNYANLNAEMGRMDIAFKEYDRLYELFPEAGRCPIDIMRIYGTLDQIGKCAFGGNKSDFKPIMRRTAIAGLLSDFGAVEEARYLYSLPDESNFYLPQQQEIFLSWIDDENKRPVRILQENRFYETVNRWTLIVGATTSVFAGDADEALKYLNGFDRSILDWSEEKYAEIAETGYFPDFLGGLILPIVHNLKGNSQAAKKAAYAMMPVVKVVSGHPSDEQYLHINLAILHAQAGENAKAIEEVKLARKAGWRFPRSFIIEFAPWPAIDSPTGFLAPLRDEPEFQRIMAEIRAENEAALEKFEHDYGILTLIRALMAEENSSP